MSDERRDNEPRGAAWMVAILFCVGMSPGFWYPTLNNVLQARGFGVWVPLAFLGAPVAAMLSPLLAGALADHRVQAQKLLGMVSLLGAALLAAAFGVLDAGWGIGAFLMLLWLFCVVTASNWSLAATVVLAHLRNAERNFPLVRIGGTVGWLVAGLIVSHLLAADASPRAGYGGALAMLAAAGIAFRLPATLPRGNRRDWRSLLGLDAVTILKQPDQLVFFVTTALVSVPVVAYYMHAPAQLRELGDTHPAATMTIGQVVEVVGLLTMSKLMQRYRLKVLLGLALVLYVVRYLLFMAAGLTGIWGLMACGVALQGLCFTFYFVTAQVFMDHRVAVGLRGQAQGLLSLASNGVGSFAGTLFVGWLHHRTVDRGLGGWPLYWAILAAMIACCAGYFLLRYRGRGAGMEWKRS